MQKTQTPSQPISLREAFWLVVALVNPEMLVLGAGIASKPTRFNNHNNNKKGGQGKLTMPITADCPSRTQSQQPPESRKRAVEFLGTDGECLSPLKLYVAHGRMKSHHLPTLGRRDDAAERDNNFTNRPHIPRFLLTAAIPS